MATEAQPSPGIVLPATGLVMVGLAVADLVTGTDPGRHAFAAITGTAGAGVAAWGWARLRRARAARPDLTWWGFLRAELIAYVVGAGLLLGWLALPREQRDGLMRATREWFELIHVARGRH